MRLTTDELRAKRDKLAAELQTHEIRIDDGSAVEGTHERADALREDIAAADRELADQEQRLSQLREIANPNHPGHISSEPRLDPERRGQLPALATDPRVPDNIIDARNAARSAIEARSDLHLSNEAGSRLDAVLAQDLQGIEAKFLRAISDEAYQSAFLKLITAPEGAGRLLNPREQEAVEHVAQATQMRALVAGTGELGGYAVPIALDPSIMLTSDGAVNPIRSLATVKTIAATVWKGITSKGAEMVFGAEASEAEDAEVKLTQPEVTPERATIWQPFSIEIGQDWGSLTAELSKVFQDARDTKEAEIFATGKGKESVPQGLITGATETVTTAGSKAVAVADIYTIQEALPPRYQPRATWLGTNAVANQIHQFVATADAKNAALMADDRSSILGKAYREVSTMSSKTTTEKELVLAYGDIASTYTIVDRIGMMVELVPQVLKEGVPTGQRGLFAFLRVGAKVTNANGTRVLKVKE